MDIKDVLDERIICSSLEAKDKEDALKQLSAKLEETGYIDDKDIFFRESQGCTGIGNGIAIPHGKSPSVTKVGIAIAKLTNEIEWETLDGKGVKVILLFAVGDKTEDAQEHLRLLAQVAGKLGNDQIVEKLLKAETVEEIKFVFL